MKTVMVIVGGLVLYVLLMLGIARVQADEVCTPVSEYTSQLKAKGFQVGSTQSGKDYIFLRDTLIQELGANLDLVDGTDTATILFSPDDTVFILWSKGDCFQGASTGPASVLGSAMVEHARKLELQKEKNQS